MFVGGFLTLLVAVRALSAAIACLEFYQASNRFIGVGWQDPPVSLVLIPLSFLLVGPGEELLFQGIIQGTHPESVHPDWALV